MPVFAGFGASMSQKNRISRSSFAVAAVCAIAISGCTATMVPSQRLHEAELSKVMGGPVQIGGQRFGMHDECASCEDRQRLQDYAHHAAPYVGGPFMHSRGGPAYVAEQATIQPPHSKFHPVPTRPVFETRVSYHPPQPMGVQLVPVPDQGFPPMMPHAGQLDSQFDPPSLMPEPTNASEFEGADAFILSPPSN